MKDLLGSEASSEEDAVARELGEVSGDFTVNKEYAQRLEHNKRREELHRLNEKYGPQSQITNDAEDASGGDDSSSSDDEDEEGVLTGTVLDQQMIETLQAIKEKDPRIYNKDVVFYSEAVEDGSPKHKEPRPMYLQDYHRANLLGVVANGDGNGRTYDQEQEEVKKDLLHGMVERDLEKSDEDEFLVAKEPRPAKRQRLEKQQDVNPDQDPEGFLNKFITTRAWVPDEQSRFQPFNSDDDDEDERADRFEEAYNLRFEDPAQANEKLLSHARDAAIKYSVRKDTTNPRKRARELERAKREEEKRIRHEEKARLKKLKVADAEEKVRQIRQAAGMAPHSAGDEDWHMLLHAAWDDETWDREMEKHYGGAYYDSRDVPENGVIANKVKKPKWRDDIEIGDLVPDFDAEPSQDLVDVSVDPQHAQKQARQERRRIEQMVDEKMREDEQLASWGTKHNGQFRYRETSPQAFGLTADDILMADDSQLNQFVGLKKMAAFRDAEKKRRDRKRLGKKARLRQWRQETFGNAEAQNRLDLQPASLQDQASAGVKKKHKKAQDRAQTG